MGHASQGKLGDNEIWAKYAFSEGKTDAALSRRTFHFHILQSECTFPLPATKFTMETPHEREEKRQDPGPGAARFGNFINYYSWSGGWWTRPGSCWWSPSRGNVIRRLPGE